MHGAGTRALAELSEDTSLGAWAATLLIYTVFVDHVRSVERSNAPRYSFVLLMYESRVASRTHLCDENKEGILRASTRIVIRGGRASATQAPFARSPS
jgi:hypothetical protein